MSSERLTWNESIAGAEATVDFDGTPAARSVLWSGITACGCAAFFAYLVWLAPHPTPWAKAPFIQPLPALLILVGLVLVWRGRPGANAGRIALAGGRFRVKPRGMFGSTLDVPLAQVEYFAGSGEDQAIDLAKPVSPEWDRYVVFIYLRGGERRVLATLREPQDALFMAQRLDSLVERMRYRMAAAPQR